MGPRRPVGSIGWATPSSASLTIYRPIRPRPIDTDRRSPAAARRRTPTPIRLVVCLPRHPQCRRPIRRLSCSPSRLEPACQSAGPVRASSERCNETRVRSVRPPATRRRQHHRLRALANRHDETSRPTRLEADHQGRPRAHRRMQVAAIRCRPRGHQNRSWCQPVRGNLTDQGPTSGRQLDWSLPTGTIH